MLTLEKKTKNKNKLTVVHEGVRLLTSHNAPQLYTCSMDAFWGWRAGQRANQLTSIGVSETEPWCAMSRGDMWFTTWPCCLTHCSVCVCVKETERKREWESKDRLYNHLLINGGHHRHLTQLIDLHSLQGLCCVSISYWLFQVYSYRLLSLPSNHCSPLSAPLGNFFKQSFEIIICVCKCHNRP